MMFYKKTDEGFKLLTQEELIERVQDNTFQDSVFCHQRTLTGEKFFLTYREVEEAFKEVFCRN